MQPRGPDGAVIFDFDGVLVDSEGLHFESLRQSLEEVGIQITREEYLAHYLAYRDRESIAFALERHRRSPDETAVARIAARKAELFEAGLPEVPLFPGAQELVLGLARVFPLAVASGARRIEIEAALGRGGLAHAFKAVVTAEDVTSGKPSPEPYLLALERLSGRGHSLPAGRCVAVEDSMAGVASAKAAGMKVVAVAHSYESALLGQADLVVPTIGSVHEDTIIRMVGDPG
jgi:beta-phosphoglucomutase-like phosphatase (HAD superfamily)